MIQDEQSNLQKWSPPRDFIQVQSLVPGVVVYAPKPEEKVEDQVKTYACPNCGANTAYNVSAGGIACEYCGYTAPIKEKLVGKRADQFEFTLENISQSNTGWGTQRQVLHCDSCGAELSISSGAVTTTCPYCASNQVNVITSPSESLRPRFLVPFKITPEKTYALAKEWLGKGWYHPNELGANTIFRKLMGIYLPFWTFDSQVYGNWRAEVGYERKVRHYNASAKRWETRTVIDWRWEEGQIHLNIDDFLVAGSNPNRISYKILKQLHPFHMQDLVAYEPDYLAGWQAQAYEVTLTEAWDQCKLAVREQAKKACYQDIPSRHVRNFSMSADFTDESWRYILLPLYIATYKHDEKAYQMMINGQTGKVAGQKPVAWWKIWLVIAALLTPGLVMGLIGAFGLTTSGEVTTLGCLGIVLFIVGLVISIALIAKARKSEEK
jgi:DNA-directed RNA polymerase subunit RPC12/RpoP